MLCQVAKPLGRLAKESKIERIWPQLCRADPFTGHVTTSKHTSCSHSHGACSTASHYVCMQHSTHTASESPTSWQALLSTREEEEDHIKASTVNPNQSIDTSNWVSSRETQEHENRKNSHCCSTYSNSHITESSTTCLQGGAGKA
jgi:hypothetical protein